MVPRLRHEVAVTELVEVVGLGDGAQTEAVMVVARSGRPRRTAKDAKMSRDMARFLSETGGEVVGREDAEEGEPGIVAPRRRVVRALSGVGTGDNEALPRLCTRTVAVAAQERARWRREGAKEAVEVQWGEVVEGVERLLLLKL